MISLLKNNISNSSSVWDNFEDKQAQDDEAHLVHLIYRFAGKKDEWFNLLLSLSNCISIYESLPDGHPYQGVSKRILSHLKNAIKISTRINAGTNTLLNSHALEQLPIAAGIMDSKGRVVDINHLALDIIENLPQWTIREQILSVEHLDLQAEIHKLVNSENNFCALPLYYDDALDNIVTQLNVPANLSTNQLYLSQLPQTEEDTEPYLYFCFNSRRQSCVDVDMLKKDYQLTETETLIVLTLLEEGSSKKICKRLKLKDATVRGHLTSIYSKMDVYRKPELIRKVMLKNLTRATQNTQFFNSSNHFNNRRERPHSERHTQITTTCFELSDGRTLSYLDLSKQPLQESYETIVVLHNMMGSAFELPPSVYESLEENNVRIIIPERPGYGDSTKHATRSHQSFCEDMNALLDHLGIDRVMLIAHSIGGAYALAMAEYLPHRVKRIAMVNAITRLEDMLKSKPIPVLVNAVHQSLRYAPFLIEPILRMAVGRDLEHFYTQQLNYMRPTKEGRAADINLLSQPVFREYCLKNLKQSAKQGIEIWSDELKLSFSEWPFSVTNKDMEYHFWHGDEDDVISVNAAIRLANELNTQHFFRLKYETHYLFSRHIKEIISTLIKPTIVEKSNSESFHRLALN